MRIVTIQQIVEAERDIGRFPPDDATNHSYREFLAFFQKREVLTSHDVTIGAYLVYGWMPRGLNVFNVNSLPSLVAIINRAKLGQFPSQDDMGVLFRSINNSLVGPSKLLHFVNPHKFAIWDSRVFRFVEGRDATQDDMNLIQNYCDYHRNVNALIAEPQFHDVHYSMNVKIGYAVTPMRACEYVMYLKGLSNNTPEPIVA